MKLEYDVLADSPHQAVDVLADAVRAGVSEKHRVELLRTDARFPGEW